MSFFRLSNLESQQNDELYLHVIGMIVTKIQRKQTPSGSFKFEFSIIQTENNYLTKVTYISETHEQELKFCRLFQPIGTLCYLNTCLPDGLGLELVYEDKMAAVAFRPNEFQVNRFLQVKIYEQIKKKCFCFIS